MSWKIYNTRSEKGQKQTKDLAIQKVNYVKMTSLSSDQ